MEMQQLLILLRQKDEKGLSYLYDSYASSLNGIITRIVGSNKLAEEVLQQTFLKIWDKIHLYDEHKSTLFTWMARIARNSALDIKRLKRFENEKNTSTLEPSHDHHLKIVPSHGKMDVEKLLNSIDPNYKIVLDCVYLNGYSHSEAAKLLDIPLGTVKSRIRLGLRVLREELASEKSLFLGTFILLIYLILLLCQ